MNVYFLVEGKQSERKVYLGWLPHLAPHLRRVKDPQQVRENHFLLVSGQGFPSILRNTLANAIKNVEDNPAFDYLVVVVDADEQTCEEREQEVVEAVRNAPVTLKSARLAVVVQNRCIETWLLGNRRVFVRNPEAKTLRGYVQHYDVSQEDPERMPGTDDFNTPAQFHAAYLKAIFRERGMRYSKNRPGEAAAPAYLDQLRRRVTDAPDHLRSFSALLSLCGEF